MGAPEAMYDEAGRKTWSCELNSCGRVRSFEGHHQTDCPFRYQGQYEDAETSLYYNRFRYYSPDEGMYLSQDPIGLAGGVTLYSYVHDTNGWLDIFGFAEHITFPTHSLHPSTVSLNNQSGIYIITATGYYHSDKIALYEAAKLKESFDSSQWISHHVSYDPQTNSMVTTQVV